MNSIAPSEKHLEDWLWDHQQFVFGKVGIGINAECPRYSIRARQVHLPSGIADFVGVCNGAFPLVVELKKGPIDSKAFAQIVRYMADIEDLIDRAIADYAFATFNSAEAQYVKQYAATGACGILIGSSVKDPRLLYPMSRLNIAVYKYKYLDGIYRFLRVTASSTERWDRSRTDIDSRTVEEIVWSCVSGHLRAFRNSTHRDAS